MKNIIWNIIVTILLIIAIVGDVKMANKTQTDFLDYIKIQSGTTNFSSNSVILNELKREGF